MKKVRKVFALVLATVMAVLTLTACGSTESNQAQPTQGTAAASSNDQAAAKKDVTLTIWHYLNDREAIMKDFAAQYEKQTGVKVDFQLYSGDQIKSKVQAAAQANSLPDAWVFSGGRVDLLKYAAAGNVLKLDDYGFKDWSSRFNQVILDQVTATDADKSTEGLSDIQAGIYGVPLDVNNMQFIYNKDLFQKAGLDPDNPPKTWNEFIEAGKKLKAANIVPFATGIGSWVQNSLTEQYQYAYMDKQTLSDSRTGKITYKAAGMENVLNMVAEMRDAKMFADGVATMDLPTAEQMFVNGQVAMIYDGSWAIGVFSSMNPDFKNYGVFFPPKDERAKNDPLIPGGIGAYFTVSKNSENAQDVVDFLKWLTDNDQQVTYANTSFNLPANKDCIDPTKLSPQTAEFANDMDKIQYTVPAYKDKPAELYSKGIQLIVIGKSPASIVEQMDDSNK